MKHETAEGIQCDLLDELDIVWERPSTLFNVPMHYCPGCGHSVVHKILMEVIEELGIEDQTVGVAR